MLEPTVVATVIINLGPGLCLFALDNRIHVLVYRPDHRTGQEAPDKHPNHHVTKSLP